MSQIGRALEAPRPLKSTIKQQSLPIFPQNLEVQTIEDLNALTEAVAYSLNQGDVSLELFNKMFTNLQIHGQNMEIYSKEVLDRCFIVFRNASCDDRLKITVRLSLLNLIELRANGWIGNKCADYYKSKAQSESDIESNNAILSSSPSAGLSAIMMNSSQTTTLLPGEIVKNSGKFSKPTKIPGKNYSKDEIVIRNSDSGKVNPGAKERLVQITGPNEENINYAKMLIEDTIKRNASPIRDVSQEGSISSLASSDDQQQIGGLRSRGGIQMAAVTQNMTPLPLGNKLARSNSHHNANFLVQSASMNDASLGEYKYTVNVGNRSVKITGDSLELVRTAKFVLDDYFANEQFLKANEAVLLNNEHGLVPMNHQIPTQPSPFIDSGVHLDLLASMGQNTNNNIINPSGDFDDEVFLGTSSESPIGNEDINVMTSSSSIESSSSSNTVVTEQQTPPPGLSRSRRSHFSRKDSTPENTKPKSDITSEQRITYTVQSLWWFCKNLPLCKVPPNNMEQIREKCAFVLREKNHQGDSIIRYCDVEKFMDLRDKMDKKNLEFKSDDIIEIDDEE
ncbi:hypothetical protein PVAND_005075 [Polypedilum vanderplanki]|uniref:Eukaryotic translation initiation factor 4E-binding protein Mextli n=1 Tax=Polypedilum vanderplanki TaxID=319348 RepID=A0A9J6BZY7_POLVA|nr:hypothetical protein PVAND_005075 [Polypedilum vanderplanki]